MAAPLPLALSRAMLCSTSDVGRRRAVGEAATRIEVADEFQRPSRSR